DVAADDLGALLLERLGDVLLAVQQHVQHAHAAARAQQLLGGCGADVAGTSCDNGQADHSATYRWLFSGAWRTTPLGGLRCIRVNARTQERPFRLTVKGQRFDRTSDFSKWGGNPGAPAPRPFVHEPPG